MTEENAVTTCTVLQGPPEDFERLFASIQKQVNVKGGVLTLARDNRNLQHNPATLQNEMARAAQTPYLAFLHDSDTLEPTFLSATIRELERNPRAAAAATWGMAVRGNGSLGLPVEIPVPSLGVWRRETFLDMGGLDESYGPWADFELNYRMWKAKTLERVTVRMPLLNLRPRPTPRLTREMQGWKARYEGLRQEVERERLKAGKRHALAGPGFRKAPLPGVSIWEGGRKVT